MSVHANEPICPCCTPNGVLGFYPRCPDFPRGSEQALVVGSHDLSYTTGTRCKVDRQEGGSRTRGGTTVKDRAHSPPPKSSPFVFIGIAVVHLAFGPHNFGHFGEEMAIVSLHFCRPLIFHLNPLQLDVNMHSRPWGLCVNRTRHFGHLHEPTGHRQCDEKPDRYGQ